MYHKCFGGNAAKEDKPSEINPVWTADNFTSFLFWGLLAHSVVFSSETHDRLDMRACDWFGQSKHSSVDVSVCSVVSIWHFSAVFDLHFWQEAESSSGLWFWGFCRSHTLLNPLPGFLHLWQKVTPAAGGGKRKCHWASFLLCDLWVWVRGGAGNTFHYEISAQHHTGKVKSRPLKASSTLCKFSPRYAAINRRTLQFTPAGQHHVLTH